MLDPIIQQDLQHIVVTLRKRRDIRGLEGAKILVTGGAGFLGSWFCDTLNSVGANVVCLDNLATGKRGNVNHLLKKKNFSFVRADIENYKPKKWDFKAIAHMASRPSPDDYQRHPIDTLTTSSQGTLNVMELARKSDARVLFTSTSEVYGDAEIIPTPESYWGNVSSTGPRSCYDEGKRYAEALVAAYNREYAIDARIVRIFNTYGPRLRAEGFYGRAVSRFILQALKNRDITVYGDGKQTRSFCYVADTTEGIALALALEKARGETINIGNPDEMSILNLAKMIKRITGSKSNITFHPLPKDDPRRRSPLTQKAKRILGWTAKTTLREGLTKSVKWFRLQGKQNQTVNIA